MRLKREIEKQLRSFNFIALKATGANVFGRNCSVGVFNLNFLNVGIIRTGGFAVTVANLVSRQFSFSANAANSRHIKYLQ